MGHSPPSIPWQTLSVNQKGKSANIPIDKGKISTRTITDKTTRLGLPGQRAHGRSDGNRVTVGRRVEPSAEVKKRTKPAEKFSITI